MGKPAAYSTAGPSLYTTNPSTDDIWLPVEDDIMICMQNATSDPNFVYTIHWLNNAKGITRTIPRTAEEARARYQFLCASGKKDARLKDSNVNRTITKLMKSMKRPAEGGPPSSTTGQYSQSMPQQGGMTDGSSGITSGVAGSVPPSSGDGNTTGMSMMSGGDNSMSNTSLNTIGMTTSISPTPISMPMESTQSTPMDANATSGNHDYNVNNNNNAI